MRKLIALSVTLFWTTMMGLLFYRYFFSPSVGYRALLEGLTKEKQTCMGIYIGEKFRVGKTETLISPKSDGTFEISSITQFSIPPQDKESFSVTGLLIKGLPKLLGISELSEDSLDLKMQTEAAVGPDYLLKDFQINVDSKVLHLTCKGIVKNARLFLSIKHLGKTTVHVLPIDQSSMAGGDFGQMVMPQLSPGKRWVNVWVNPITKQRTRAVSNVINKVVINIHGNNYDAFVVKTKLDSGMTTTSWVSPDGVVLKHQVLFITMILENNE